MHTINDRIITIYNIVMQVQDYLINNKLDDAKTLDKYSKILLEHVQTFKRLVKDNNVKALINEEAARLFKIHNILVGKIGKLYITDITTFRKPHDILFTECLGIKVPRKRFSFLPTQITTNLCKGITFFANDTGINEVPFYHRDTSCGPKDRRNMTHKEFVRMCYIERLIYDAVYSFVFYEQNIEHLVELRNVERAFQDYFKGYSITVRVYAPDDLYPNKVMITSDHGYYDTPIFERYIKHKNGRVECTKIGHDHTTYHKTQTFEQETPWILDGGRSSSKTRP